MFLIDTVILVTGVMVLLGIASSKFSARLGVPVLVLFIAMGMLAGSEGIGGIEFEDYVLAHGIGTLALALILFDGGLRTPFTSIRLAWKPSLLLATIGVVITALVTGTAVSWILGISLLEGLLLGSIVGSTDAAAVFAILRSGGVHLPTRLSAILEIESGSNDPMAVFLTIGCLEVLSGSMPFGPGLLTLFGMQMALGTIVGIGVGYVATGVINRINMDAAGLYPGLATAFGLLAFGLAAALGGSGFLGVYLAGIVIGNSRIVFKRGILLFHDAGAWLGQIVMFVVLGLLVFPSQVLEVTGQGLLIAAVLIFVARPVATVLTLAVFRFQWRELLFLSWVGLKGAVPITLATFPLLFGIEGASQLFNVVFFVVLVSALIQGWTLPLMARSLGLEMPAEPAPPVTLELTSLRHVEGDIVDYLVNRESRAAGRLVRELALPEGVVIALIARGQQIIPPQGKTRIEAGDHVTVVLRPGTMRLVNKLFASAETRPEEIPASVEFPLRGSITVGELEEFYGIQMQAPAGCTLDQALRERLGPEGTKAGGCVTFGPITLYVRDLSDGGTIEQVGMVILPPENSASMHPTTAGIPDESGRTAS